MEDTRKIAGIEYVEGIRMGRVALCPCPSLYLFVTFLALTVPKPLKQPEQRGCVPECHAGPCPRADGKEQGAGEQSSSLPGATLSKERVLAE